MAHIIAIPKPDISNWHHGLKSIKARTLISRCRFFQAISLRFCTHCHVCGRTRRPEITQLRCRRDLTQFRPVQPRWSNPVSCVATKCSNPVSGTGRLPERSQVNQISESHDGFPRQGNRSECQTDSTSELFPSLNIIKPAGVPGRRNRPVECTKTMSSKPQGDPLLQVHAAVVNSGRPDRTE